MGHIHLGVLPKTRKWREVVELLADGGSDLEVIAAAAIAAEKDFSKATGNPVFVEAVRLLLTIPHAARSDQFVGELHALGLPVGEAPELFDILAAVSARLDSVARKSGGHDDFAELASRSLFAALSDQIGNAIPGLFGSTPEDVRIAARNLSWRNGISDLTRAFFADLVARSLSYWLDRTLANHIGDARRFQTVADRSAFDMALRQHAWEATRIIKEFAPGWYGKRLHEDGTVKTDKAAAFAAIAFRKITEELRVRRDGDV